MPKKKSLFNINRLVQSSGEDTSPEVSFLQDLDYTLRRLNRSEHRYYFKEIFSDKDSEYFNKNRNVVLVNKLPDRATEEHYFENRLVVYHTDDNRDFVCIMSDGKPSKKYKPSSLHCIRCMYYQMIGADLDKQSDKSGDFYGICESGEDRHIRIQRAISRMCETGVQCEFIDVEAYIKENNIDLEVVSKKEFETKLYDRNRNLIFLCDGIIKYKDKYYILEIKTETSYKWMQRDNYDESHRYQAFAYSLELVIDSVLFIYENRDLCTKKSYILNVSDEDRQFIVDRLDKCDEYVSLNVTPPKEESITKKVCQYCDYKTLCKLEEVL